MTLEDYKKKHEAVMAARGLCTTDPTPDNLNKLHQSYIDRAACFDRLKTEDKLHVCTTFFPEELGGDAS